MCASWDISSGGNVVTIGRKIWLMKLDQPGKLPMRIKDIMEKDVVNRALLLLAGEFSLKDLKKDVISL